MNLKPLNERKLVNSCNKEQHGITRHVFRRTLFSLVHTKNIFADLTPDEQRKIQSHVTITPKSMIFFRRKLFAHYNCFDSSVDKGKSLVVSYKLLLKL